MFLGMHNVHKLDFTLEMLLAELNDSADIAHIVGNTNRIDKVSQDLVKLTLQSIVIPKYRRTITIHNRYQC